MAEASTATACAQNHASLGSSWGTVRLSAVSHADIQVWVGRLTSDRSPSTARKAHRVLSLVLSLAVRDGRIGRNPAIGIALPRETPGERRYLSHEQVHALAAAAGPAGVTILVPAYTGMRFGVLAGLTVENVDLERRRIRIVQSVTSVDGELV